MAKKECNHMECSRSWFDCEEESHPQDCVVGQCDNCDAVVSHDYGMEDLNDDHNDRMFAGIPEDPKVAQNYRDAVYNQRMKRKHDALGQQFDQPMGQLINLDEERKKRRGEQ